MSGNQSWTDFRHFIFELLVVTFKVNLYDCTGSSEGEVIFEVMVLPSP